MASFVLSFFPLDVLDEIWDLIESVSEGFLTYSYLQSKLQSKDKEASCFRLTITTTLQKWQQKLQESVDSKHQ